MDKTQNIALFGGSFDPPHIGHIRIIDTLLKFDDIQKVVVMPTFLNPFKSKSYANSELRLKWLKKIFKNYDKIVVSDYEILQHKKVPTIQTVEHLLHKYSKIYLVIGADNLKSLDKWYNYDKLKNNVSFVVATRDDINIPDSFRKIKIDEDISSSILRENIDISKLPIQCADEIYEFYKRISI